MCSPSVQHAKLFLGKQLVFMRCSKDHNRALLKALF